MSNLKAQMLINLGGNLERKARVQGDALEKMGKKGTRSMQVLQKSMAKTHQSLERAGGRYTSMAAGFVTGVAAKGVIDLEQRIERLGIQSGKSKEDMQQLKKEVFEVAQKKEIRVDPSQMLYAINAIVEKTGDLDFARNNLDNIGLSIQATGAYGGAIGELLAEFQKMGIKAPKEVMKAMDVMNVQGKEGAFTLENLAALGPRVINAYTATGRTGVTALKEMGAALQVIRMGVGSSEQAATAFEATLSALNDRNKLRQLQRMGVQVYDPEQLAKGKKELRPINELMKEIVTNSNASAMILNPVFGAEGIRSFNKLMADFKKTGQLDVIDKFMEVQADGTTTIEDSARAAATSAAALQYLHTSLAKFADNNLADKIAALADAVNSLEPETVERIFKGIAYGVGALIAYSAGAKLIRGVGGAYRGIKGKGSAGVGDALMGRGNTPALPMYVSIVGGMPGKGGKKGKGGVVPPGSKQVTPKSSAKPVREWGKIREVGKLSAGRKAMMGASKAALPLAAAYGAYQTYNIVSDDSLSTRQKVDAGTELAGGLAGGAAGAKLGALIGTAILPGIGTAIGGALGGIGGYLAGSYGGDKLGDLAVSQPAENRPATANLEVAITDERTVVKKAEGRGVTTKVRTGNTGPMLEGV